jgi:hypothetical protein
MNFQPSPAVVAMKTVLLDKPGAEAPGKINSPNRIFSEGITYGRLPKAKRNISYVPELTPTTASRF